LPVGWKLRNIGRVVAFKWLSLVFMILLQKFIPEVLAVCSHSLVIANFDLQLVSFSELRVLEEEALAIVGLENIIHFVCLDVVLSGHL